MPPRGALRGKLCGSMLSLYSHVPTEQSQLETTKSGQSPTACGRPGTPGWFRGAGSLGLPQPLLLANGEAGQQTGQEAGCSEDE